MLADSRLCSFWLTLFEEVATRGSSSQRNSYGPVPGFPVHIRFNARGPYLVHGLCNGCESCHGRYIPKRRQCWH